MSESWQVDSHKVIEVGSSDQPLRRVKIAIVGGRIDVVAHREDDEPEGRLEIHDVQGRPLDVRWDGETLEVSHPQAHWDSLLRNLADRARGEAHALGDTAELSLAVPAGVDLQIGSVSAEGLVCGLSGKVEVRTVSGAVTLDGLSGPVTARSVSGSVDARGQRGRMVIDSVSGSFTVESAGAPAVVAKTVSGSLGVDVVDAGEGRDGGHGRDGGDAGAPLTLTFASVSGELVLRSPGRGFDAELRSVSGHVVVGQERIRNDHGAVLHRRRDPGAATKVKASTVSGNITLLPASTPGSAGVAGPVLAPA